MLRKDFTATYAYLTGEYREDKAKLFPKMYSDNTKGKKTQFAVRGTLIKCKEKSKSQA